MSVVRAFNCHDLFGRAIQELVTGPPKLNIKFFFNSLHNDRSDSG